MTIDHAKIRRESIRWHIISSLNISRPAVTHEVSILSFLQALYPETTALEVRRELQYLADRLLIELRKEPSGAWFSDLTALGVDVAEYTVDVHPGINRPIKYW